MLRFIASSVNKPAPLSPYSSVCGGINAILKVVEHWHLWNRNSATSIMEHSAESNHLQKLTINQEYEKAIQTLNTLQSNAETIRQSIALGKKQMSLVDMRKYLERTGLRLEEVEKQSFIHVSGTKGKGSTCAITESILRAHGVRTGFFSSPHLVSVTERIRINGEPYSKKKFTEAFWKVYLALHNGQEHPKDMPGYFRFLTILSFHIFIAENVDVIILEVGIGGELDCTNIVRNTKTVGITSLGLEHTQLLGNTLKEIAWQKAGIIKPHSHVFTSVNQPECLEIIRHRTTEKNATLYIVPPWEKYSCDTKISMMPNEWNEVIKLNGSLAIQLANDWLRSNKTGYSDSITNGPILTEQLLHGLKQCAWPGRYHILKIYNLNIHLDGAHTVESMYLCSEWFSNCTRSSMSPKIVVFNTTGNRDVGNLLTILRANNQFDMACFVPNISSGCIKSSDNTSVFGISEQLTRAKFHADLWRKLCCSEENCGDVPASSHIFGSNLDCIKYIRDRFGNERELDVLVTGSLHLIGSFLVGLGEYKARIESA